MKKSQIKKLERARDLIEKGLGIVYSLGLIVYVSSESVRFIKPPVFTSEEDPEPIYENVMLEFPNTMEGGGY